MKNTLKLALNFLFISLFSLPSFAALNPGATYYVGETEVKDRSANTVGFFNCHLEVLPDTEEASIIIVRASGVLPHLNQTTDELIEFSAGPHSAELNTNRGFYRYEDSADAAPVKDWVLFSDSNGVLRRHGLEYWHAERGHHDPIACEDLQAVDVNQLVTENPELLKELEEAFDKEACSSRDLEE